MIIIVYSCLVHDARACDAARSDVAHFSARTLVSTQPTLFFTPTTFAFAVVDARDLHRKERAEGKLTTITRAQDCCC